MFRLLAVLITLCACLNVLPANAMQFSLLQDANGQKIVLAQGPIGPGDAGRLIRALRKASVDKHGTRALWLNSPGGTVLDAMNMADVINAVGVTTVVPAKAMCASACASVVFVAGKYRTVEKGGQLLIHSCFDARNGQKMDQCDAVISQRAEANGLSGRAMFNRVFLIGNRPCGPLDKPGDQMQDNRNKTARSGFCGPTTGTSPPSKPSDLAG